MFSLLLDPIMRHYLVAGLLLISSNSFADTLECPQVKQQWDQVKQTVADWAQHPDQFVPTPPPVYKFDCYGESSRAARDARQRGEATEFANNYFSKERVAAGELLRLEGVVEICGVATEREARDLSKKAVDVMKARTLQQMRQLQGFAAPAKYDYYYSAIIGTYGAERAVTLLGGEFPELTEVRTAMLQEVVDYLGSELVREHDLQITPRAFVDLLRAAVQSGLVTDSRALAVLDRVLGFYRFQVNFDQETRLGNGDPMMKFIKRQPEAFVNLERVGQFGGSSQILLRYRPQIMKVNETGIGQMDAGTLSYLRPEFYTTDFNFETFACEEGNPNVLLSLSRFGADAETWRMCDSEGNCANLPSMAASHIVAISILRKIHAFAAETLWPEALYSPMSPALAFTFKVPLTNRAEKIVDWEAHGQIESDGQVFFEQVSWKVFHRPNSSRATSLK